MSIEDKRPPGKEAIEKMSKENEAAAIAKASRYHRLFVQNKDGADILAEWINRFCFGGFTGNDASPTALAKAEARREFVSMIVTELNVINRSK